MLLLAAAAAAALTFHAPLDTSARATLAGGRHTIEPLAMEGVAFADGRARIAPKGLLRFDAGRAVDLAQGTVSFWWKPAAGAAFAVTHAGRLDSFAALTSVADRLDLAVRDRDLTDWRAAAEGVTLTQGRWRHIAVTWTELSGAALYVDGRRSGAIAGPLYFSASARAGALEFRGGEVDEVRVYSGALAHPGVAQLARREEVAPLPALSPPPPLAGRMGWHAAANVQSASRLRVKKVGTKDARALNRFSWRLTDGADDTAWPTLEAEGRYRDEKVEFTITPAGSEPYNVVRSTGNASAQIQVTEFGNAPRASPHHLHYFRSRHPRSSGEVLVSIHSGTLTDVSLLRVEPLPADREVFGPIVLAAAQDSAIRGVRVEFSARPAVYYRLAVPDPVDESRRLIEFDLRANAEAAVVELEFAPCFLRAGRSMRVEVVSSDEGRSLVTPSKLTWLSVSDAAAARPAFIERRRLELRDLYQRETATGIRPSSAAALAEDLLYWSPADALALRMAGRPPAAGSWTEPAAPAGVPRWAWQQVAIVRLLKKTVDWWIDHRQVDSGEFGNGPDADAALLRLWPEVAWLDGKVERYRQSARKLYDWLVTTKWAPADAVGALALAIHPGNPRLTLAVATPLMTPPAPAPVGNLEARQAVLWRDLERDVPFLTEEEPASIALDTGVIAAARLGLDRAVSWENTGGELAAHVIAAEPHRLQARLFSLGRFARRVKLRVRRLEHGDYSLALRDEAREIDTRRLTLKPDSPIELDLPAQRLVTLELNQFARRTAVQQLPDLAIAPEEVTRDPGGDLLAPVFNLGGVETAGAAVVSVFAPDSSQVLAQVRLDTPIKPKERAEARFRKIDPAAGLRFQARLDTDAAEALDSNNEAILTPADARRLAQLLRP